MRARTGFALNARALLRAGLAVLAIWLATAAAPALAQYESYPDEVVEEEVPDTSGAPYPAGSSPFSAGDARSWANAAALYTAQPDLAHCTAGVLRTEAKAAFLSAFNALRALHGLAPVRYNSAADHATGEAAMMMAANDALSHDPPPSWKCWSAAGAGAAGSSNLLGGVSSPYLGYEDDNAVLAEWLIEGDSDAIGHRRWLLDPYLDQTAFGRFIAVLPGGERVDSAVMKVFDFPATSPNDSGHDDLHPRGSHGTIPEFVAWPQGAYPRMFFSPRARFSFSISQDPADVDASGTPDFSDAVVSISDGDHLLPVRDQLWDNEGYGVSNCLSWRIDGIVAGKTYAVTISGIRGAPRERYAYTFRITG